jgi:hypothetical protein
MISLPAAMSCDGRRIPRDQAFRTAYRPSNVIVFAVVFVAVIQ